MNVNEAEGQHGGCNDCIDLFSRPFVKCEHAFEEGWKIFGTRADMLGQWHPRDTVVFANKLTLDSWTDRDKSGIDDDDFKEIPVKIAIETVVNASLSRVWDTWSNPADIKQWNAPQDDWHTTRSTVDLREGGKFLSRMEAKDGSAGFDFEGTYTRIVPQEIIEYRISDGREVKVEFVERADGVLVNTAFDAETENPPEMQRAGWQAILDNFGRYVEAKG